MIYTFSKSPPPPSRGAQLISLTTSATLFFSLHVEVSHSESSNSSASITDRAIFVVRNILPVIHKTLET
jgi:hypothetical protein